MLGNVQFLAYKVSKETGIPKEWLEVAYEMYWEVVRERLNYSEASGIYLANLGTFFATNSELRGYIRKCIRTLRYIRLELQKPDNEPERIERYLKWEEDKIKRLRAAWKQLEAIRRVFQYNIAKTARIKAKYKNEQTNRIS